MCAFFETVFGGLGLGLEGAGLGLGLGLETTGLGLGLGTLILTTRLLFTWNSLSFSLTPHIHLTILISAC